MVPETEEEMFPETEEKSRTKAKHEVEALQRLGERLIELSKEQIKSMAIPDDLKREVLFAKTITRHGAKRRQLQYIGSIMRDIDPESVVTAIDRLSMARAMASSKFKKMEQLRDELIQGNQASLDSFIDDHPQADRQRLRQLARNAKNEIAAEKPPKSSRALFKYIREITEAQDD
jgi:ribosome-associated protein